VAIPPPVKRSIVEPIISVRMNSRRVRGIVVATEQLEIYLRVFSVPRQLRF
jgi:hypothetical protein